MSTDTLRPHTFERFAVDSSSIKSAGYQDGVLVVEFVGGHLYAYPMGTEDFEAFASAPSKGRHFNNQIKGKFEGRKLTGRCGALNCGSEPQIIGEPCAVCGSVVRVIDRVHKETER